MKAETEKECVACGVANDATYRTCRNCKGTTLRKPEVYINFPNKRPENRYKPYHHFNIQPKSNSITVQIGEPDMLNPNSFEYIVSILKNLGKRANITNYDSTGEHEWLLLENDGGILFICLKLIYLIS